MLVSDKHKGLRVVGSSHNLAASLARRIIGQPAAMTGIVPYVQLHEAGLAPDGRPAGVFLLLGPSGTGKTKTVEALADVLHGSERNLLRIDCGELQMEHEVAKLIGAPPGYLGHRETQPILTQSKLNSVSSEKCKLSLVLFDEIEKAAPSLTRLLLGILDKASLRLGDNTHVNFEKTLIFLTSNLGAREMLNYLKPGFGFGADSRTRTEEQVVDKLQSIGMAAVKKRFAPEFVNRVDAVITYRPLGRKALDGILELQLVEIERHIHRRLGSRAFGLQVAKSARTLLLDRGTSEAFGARELKRTLHRELVHPIGMMVADGAIAPGATVRIDVARGGSRLRFRVTGKEPDELRPAA